MIAIDALFDFCDLHTSRWETWPMWWRARLRYFDRQGFPLPGEEGDEGSLGLMAWAQLHGEPENRIVAQDRLPDGGLLSTVWLGLDHCSWPEGAPQIFETMRFSGEQEKVDMLGHECMVHPSTEFEDPRDGEQTEQCRYATLEEATSTHHEILRRLRVREGH
jgi:hypothetical protein